MSKYGALGESEKAYEMKPINNMVVTLGGAPPGTVTDAEAGNGPAAFSAILGNEGDKSRELVTNPMARDLEAQKLPTDELGILAGLVLCFFGGLYPMTLAAFEAYKQCGGEDTGI